VSQENVERVRRAYEFVNREHAPDLDLLHPDIQWHTRADLPDSATYRGHDAVAALMAEWFGGAFDDLRVDVEELIDAGDRVQALSNRTPRTPRLGMRCPRFAPGQCAATLRCPRTKNARIAQSHGT
jgi:ketosteroid isomerase-like protein